MVKTGTKVVTVRCMAHLQPSFLDFVLSRDHAEGVLLLGCEDGNCNYRLGAEWTEARIDRVRDPRLRKRTDTSKIAMGWLGPWGNIKDPAEKLAAFKASLAAEERES
jgi:coenzyme F420-reducing hydrogenase delta subunit